MDVWIDLRNPTTSCTAFHPCTCDMWAQRALRLSLRIPIPRQSSAAAAARSHSTTTASSAASNAAVYEFGSPWWRKPHWNLMLGIILSGQTVIFLGLSRNRVFAEDDSPEKSVTENGQGQAYVTGLRRIDDGSIISNVHTSKWRIFTDNGRDLFLKGKLDEAEKFFLSALHEAKEGFGPRDPHVASSCNNLAELYRVRKVFEKAEPLYLEAINILEESFGAEDIRVGAALHNLGQFYLSQRKLDQARTCYERALKIKGRILGYGHPDYANTMYHLGTVLHLQGNEKDSEALIQESIRILEEGGQGETATCIRRMKYLAQILLSSNRLAEAENIQRKILHILELSKGWDSLETVIAAEGLALTLQTLGNLTEAQELLERCLDVRKKILPQEHIQVAANMLHLARIALLKANHLQKMKITEARIEFDKAKHLIENTVRVAKVNLVGSGTNWSNRQNSRDPPDGGNDANVVLTILLQSLDFIGLLEVTKHELLEAREALTTSEAELALRECISIFKEPSTRSLLSSPDLRKEYLSCMKHLMALLSENKENETHKSGAVQELKDEVRQIEVELSSNQRHKK